MILSLLQTNSISLRDIPYGWLALGVIAFISDVERVRPFMAERAEDCLPPGRELPPEADPPLAERKVQYRAARRAIVAMSLQ
ncbi:MAG: hypothetical protein P4L74_06525 [Candidatus Doudnabacteria bacterium]|nr:hypothetical protein [Candidatus Doudnabacteria bacterium]